MVDVDRRVNAQNQAHLAGLKRLSARANKGPNPSTPLRRGLVSLSMLAKKVIERLRKCGVLVEKGLCDEEFARIEAEFGFSFPPDLRAVLQEGLPVGVDFPDWRSGGSQQLRMRLNLPVAGLSYEVARGKFWWKQWGQRPADTENAVRIARHALRKVPILVPLYGHCYIPSSPELAGNPVFFVYQKDVFCCGYDLADFFEREAFGPHDQELDFMTKKVLGHSERWLRREKSMNLRRHEEESYYKEQSDHLSRRNNNSKRERLHFADVKCEESWRSLEDWGRNLNSLAKCSEVSYNKDCSDWSRRSVDRPYRRKSCHSFLRSADNSPRLIQDKPISDKIFANLEAAPSPPWLLNTPRWIEFWSDLAERRKNSCMLSPERLFSSSKVDVELAKSAVKENLDHLQYRSMPRWIRNYLEDLATVLRNGGWREEDINDIVEVSSSPFDVDNVYFDSQAVMEGMLLKADSMSDSLRRAGWSSQDVSEAFDFDFPRREPKRPAKKLSPEFVERIGKLAEYVAQA